MNRRYFLTGIAAFVSAVAAWRWIKPKPKRTIYRYMKIADGSQDGAVISSGDVLYATFGIDGDAKVEAPSGWTLVDYWVTDHDGETPA